MTLDMLGCIVGLIYIYQEYKASIWLWLTGIIMSCHLYVCLITRTGLYADFGMQIYYTLASHLWLLVLEVRKEERGGGDSYHALSSTVDTPLIAYLPPSLGCTLSHPHQVHELYRTGIR